jgi:Tol biopolymer transport system component
MRIPGSFNWITAVAWSPRGKILAVLTSPGDGNPSLWTLSVSGRDTTLVVQPAEGKIDSWAWASSGDAIYYVTKDELWRVPVSATTGQRIGPSRRLLSNTPIAEDGRNYISLTTSGLRLAYSKLQLQANVWVGAAAATLGPAKSTAMRQLTTGTTVKRCVAVSPDLQRIAFIQLGSDGGRDIYSALVASGTIDRVTFTGTVSGSSCPVWSPSGLSIAFLATVAGERRVAVVSASAGGAPQIFAKKTDHIYTWLQNGRIVYQMPGNRNVGLFDPKTGVDQPLVANDSVGWLFNPVFSPDGKRVVVYWNRSEAGGLWLVSLVDRSQRLLPHDPSSALGVLGWTRDGNALLIRGADRFVRRIPLTGGAGTVVATVPPISSCELIEPPQRLTLVCMIVDPTEDVWMVENFDPAVRASKK